MRYVAIDVETADAANSAPCAIGMTYIDDDSIGPTERILINPETAFSPFSSKIHGITENDVADKPTFPQIWDKIKSALETCTPIAHNAAFDCNVLRKSAIRYDISFPEVECLDTMLAANEYLSLDNSKLSTVCKALDMCQGTEHDAGDDSLACAKIALHFLSCNLQIPCVKFSSALSNSDAVSLLDNFEKECLVQINRIFEKNQIFSPLIRYKKDKTLGIEFYYRTIKIGITRNRRFLGVRTKYQETVDTALEHDSIKAFDRYFLSSPEDIWLFEKYICTIALKSISDFENYKTLVSERTLKKHLSEYYQHTYSLT